MVFIEVELSREDHGLRDLIVAGRGRRRKDGGGLRGRRPGRTAREQEGHQESQPPATAHRSCRTISVSHGFLLSSVVGMILRSCAQNASHPQDILWLRMELARRNKPLCMGSVARCYAGVAPEASHTSAPSQGARPESFFPGGKEPPGRQTDRRIPLHPRCGDTYRHGLTHTTFLNAYFASSNDFKVLQAAFAANNSDKLSLVNATIQVTSRITLTMSSASRVMKARPQ